MVPNPIHWQNICEIIFLKISHSRPTYGFSSVEKIPEISETHAKGEYRLFVGVMWGKFHIHNHFKWKMTRIEAIFAHFLTLGLFPFLPVDNMKQLFPADMKLRWTSLLYFLLRRTCCPKRYWKTKVHPFLEYTSINLFLNYGSKFLI